MREMFISRYFRQFNSNHHVEKNCKNDEKNLLLFSKSGDYFFTCLRLHIERGYGMNECHDASQNFVNQATFSFHFSYFCSVSLSIYSTEVQDVARENLRGGGRIPRI